MQKFPEWLTQEDRELTMRHALTEAGLHTEGGPQLGSSPHRGWSVMMARRSSLQSPSSQCPTCLSGRRPCRSAVEFDLDMQKRRRSLSLKMSRRTLGTKCPHRQKQTCDQRVDQEWLCEVGPGATQFERGPGAPFYGLTNAYQQAFPKYGKEPLVPRCKTLVLEHSQGAWVGRVSTQEVLPQPQAFVVQ